MASNSSQKTKTKKIPDAQNLDLKSVWYSNGWTKYLFNPNNLICTGF